MKHRFRYIVHGCAPGITVILAEEDAHHLTRVVRRGIGDDVEILDEHGNVWDAAVADIGTEVRVRLADGPRPAPSRPPVELALGLADWGRLDTAVEKATEIGVQRITVFRSERSGRVPDATAFSKRRERMLRVAEAAMRQSGHAVAPDIDGIAPFEDVIIDRNDLRVVVVDPRGESGLTDALRDVRGGAVRLVIGPDAGLSEDEIARAREAGCALARLGEGILRAETAAIVTAAITAEAYRWGRDVEDGIQGSTGA